MTLKFVGNSEFEATEVIIGGERFLLIPFDALNGLFHQTEQKPAAPAAPKPINQRRVHVARKPKQPAENSQPTPAPPAEVTPLQDEILARLTRKPLSSGDVIKALEGKATAGSIYQALSAMRKIGAIETREDPSDGYKKNFAQKAAA